MTAHKQSFLMKWVSNPEWTDAYFTQSLTFEETKSEELTTIPTSGRKLRKFLGTNALKKYKRKLRKAKAKDYTGICEVYEKACADPIVAPPKIPPAVSSRVRGSASRNPVATPQEINRNWRPQCDYGRALGMHCMKERETEAVVK